MTKKAEEPDFSDLEELTDEPEPEPQPEAEGKAPEPEPKEAEQAEVVDDPTITIGNVSKKQSEWSKFLQDSETWRNQASHFQGKYTEALEQIRGAQPAPTPSEPRPSGPPSSTDVVRWAEPIRKAAVDQKAFGEEAATFFETWPEVASWIVYWLSNNGRMAERASQGYERFSQQQRDSDFAQARETFDTTVDALAQEPEFAMLADPTQRGGFQQYFIENSGHLPLDRLTPDFVRRQLVGYLAPAFQEAMKAAATNKAKPTRRNAAGEGSAARPATRASESDFDREARELEEV